ncbi:MAG: hypothetical protein WCD35_04465 [Mycobacteriales bacterium]
MTTAEVETSGKRRPAAARTEPATGLTDELLEAGSALAERGVRIVRTAADTGLKVTDTFVLGSLEVAQEWATASPVAALTLPPVKVARDTWTTTRDGLRELVAAV